MATINLGRVKLVNRGTWSSANTYAIDDFVQYTDSGVLSTYIAVAASSNQVPSTGGTENASFWKFMSKGTTVAVGNNKVVTTDGSGNLQGLSIGSTGQILRVTGSNTVGFGADEGASIYSANSATTTTYGNTATIDPLAVSFTPKSTSSKILIICSMNGELSSGGWDMVASLRREISGGTTVSNMAETTFSQTGGAYNGFSCSKGSYGAGDNNSTPEGYMFSITDQPNTSSQVTYKPVVFGTETFYFNRVITTNNERFVSNMTVVDFGG